MGTLRLYLSLVVISLALVAAAATPVSASPNVSINLPDYCVYYDVDKPQVKVWDPWYQQYVATVTIQDVFAGRDYYGCSVNASKYPSYRGWVGHVLEREVMTCGTKRLPLLPDHPSFVWTGPMPGCPEYWPAEASVWKLTSNGYKKIPVTESALMPISLDTRLFVQPFYGHPEWRWVYRWGSWYAVKTQHVQLAWLVKL